MSAYEPNSRHLREDAELEALLDQDLCQTQQELAKSLGVTQEAISKRLKAMGMNKASNFGKKRRKQTPNTLKH